MLIKMLHCTVLRAPSAIPVHASYLPLPSSAASYKIKKYNGEHFQRILLNHYLLCAWPVKSQGRNKRSQPEGRNWVEEYWKLIAPGRGTVVFL